MDTIIKFLPLFVSAISVMIAIISLLVALRQYNVAAKAFQESHEYNRRLNAVQLVAQWDEKTAHIRQTITHHWPETQQRNCRIEWKAIEAHLNDEVNAIKKHSGEYPQVEQCAPLITEQMSMLLNWFESMAAFVLNGVADEEIVKMCLGNAFHRWYNILSDYIEEVSIERGYNAWEPLDALHDRWFGIEVHGRHSLGVLNSPTGIGKTMKSSIQTHRS